MSLNLCLSAGAPQCGAVGIDVAIDYGGQYMAIAKYVRDGGEKIEKLLHLSNVCDTDADATAAGSMQTTWWTAQPKP